MNELHLSSKESICIMKSWEEWKEISGFREKLGVNTLVLLCKMDPRAMMTYGFNPSSLMNINKGIQSMGVLTHGLNIMHMLDSLVAAASDPDAEDILPLIIRDFANQQSQLGLSPQHFVLLCRAFLQALSEALRDQWTCELKNCWFRVMRYISCQMSSCMEEQQREKRSSVRAVRGAIDCEA